MRSQAARLIEFIVVSLAGTGLAMAQHATGSDIADGERAFADSCANCHGPDGDLIAGIDLGRGLFRRDYTDQELIGIMMDGIPDTPMPPTPGMSVPQAERIVAYLRAMAAEGRGGLLVGDQRNGRQIFFQASDCTDCHAVFGQGARHGPDLSQIGRERRAAEIEAALRDPESAVQPTNRSYEVTLANGDIVRGRILNHDTFTVQLIDTDERLRSFVKSEVASHGFVETSMRAYGDELSDQEIADLVSFLTSLQGLN